MGSFFSICCCEERTDWLFDDSQFDLALACAVAPAAVETKEAVFVIPMGLGATGFFCSVRAELESFSDRILSAAADFCCSVVSSIFQAIQYVERKVRPVCRKIFQKALAPQDCYGRTPLGWRL